MVEPEQVEAEAGSQGSVRITKSGRGIGWSVAVPVGAREEDLEAARRLAELIAGRLERDLATKSA